MRRVSPSFAKGAISMVPRGGDSGVAPIDLQKAQLEHDGYVNAVRQCVEGSGADVVVLDADDDAPDCCFVEDLAVVARGLAFLTRPGAPSRQREAGPFRAVFEKWGLEVMDMHTMDVHLASGKDVATVDGGDCLFLGDVLFVGRSSRTNDAGIAQLADAFSHVHLPVVPVDVPRGLHLKSSLSGLDQETILAHDHPDTEFLVEQLLQHQPRDVIRVPDQDAANAVRIGSAILYNAKYEYLPELLHPFASHLVGADASEAFKADGLLTCQSVIVERS